MNLSGIYRNLILAEIPTASTGRPLTISHSETLDVLFKVLRTGMQWREINASVHYTVILKRFHKWNDLGVFKAAYCKLLKTYKKLNKIERYCIDSTYNKNKYCSRKHTGKNHTDRGRQALKTSVICDQNKIVHSIDIREGNRNDVILMEPLLANPMLALTKGTELYADRGYNSRRNSEVCKQYGLRDRIFRKKTKTVRRENSKRVRVEHVFADLQKYRRLLNVFDKSKFSFYGFIILALGHKLGTFMKDQIYLL